MKIEDHLRNIKESIEVIEESIQKGIQDRQRNIGFNTSVAGVEMLEVFLHKENLLHPSLILKHEWFNSEKIAYEKLPFEFPDKKKIINLLCRIQEKRNILCYSKKRPLLEIQASLNYFNELKQFFESRGLKWN